MRQITGQTFADVYRLLLLEVSKFYEYETAPRNMKIREIMNCVLTIQDPYSNLFKNEVRSLPLKYLKKEIALYLSGRNDLQGFANASKFWNRIANTDGTVNSAYGYLIFNMKDTPEFMSQWEWAKKSLESDKDTRQAVMHFNRPIHQYNGVKDFPCTLELTFHIRDNKLNLTTCMRSNDVVKGTTFDIPFFTLLQQLMLLELKKKYPEVRMGTYTHIAHSMHLYESDFDLVEKMLTKEFMPDRIPLLTSAGIINSEWIDLISHGKMTPEGVEFFENNDFLKWVSNLDE